MSKIIRKNLLESLPSDSHKDEIKTALATKESGTKEFNMIKMGHLSHHFHNSN